MRPLSADAARESILRFDLNVQRRHLLVYTAALVTVGVCAALRVIPLQIGAAIGIWAAACACSGVFYLLYERGIDRHLLNPLWMAADVLFVTIGVYATGGLGSPYYIWYIATS